MNIRNLQVYRKCKKNITICDSKLGALHPAIPPPRNFAAGPSWAATLPRSELFLPEYYLGQEAVLVFAVEEAEEVEEAEDAYYV